jgi:CDP-diacylglycerol--inositol 3-phosphatidyltransferase
VLFTCCALNELFFISLYLLSFSSPRLSPWLLQQSTDMAAIHKGAQANSTLLNRIFMDPYSAGALELARANKMDSTVPWIMAGISLPVMLIKQLLNVLQLVKASRWLADEDLKLRKEKGLPRKKSVKAR